MIRIAIVTLALLLALGREAAAQDAAAAPRLKELVAVTSEIVRIGDLVENAGAAPSIAGVPRARSRPDRHACRSRASIEALRPHDIDRARHRRPVRGGGHAAVSRAITGQGHRRAHRRAPSPASSASATRKTSRSRSTARSASLHVEADRDGRSCGRADERRRRAAAASTSRSSFPAAPRRGACRCASPAPSPRRSRPRR